MVQRTPWNYRGPDRNQIKPRPPCLAPGGSPRLFWPLQFNSTIFWYPFTPPEAPKCLQICQGTPEMSGQFRSKPVPPISPPPRNPPGWPGMKGRWWPGKKSGCPGNLGPPYPKSPNGPEQKRLGRTHASQKYFKGEFTNDRNHLDIWLSPMSIVRICSAFFRGVPRPELW